MSHEDPSHEITYSVVVPAFCEADSLVELADRVEQVFTQLGFANKFEILIVDDGSTDSTPAVIKRLAQDRPYLRCIVFRRNCGKSLALMAGFQSARGSIVITMDADLQDDPKDIPNLVKKLGEGFDLVSGWRQERQDLWIRRMGSRFYNWTVARLSGLDIHDANCGFKAYRAEVTKTITVYGQYHRFLPILAHLLGFKVAEAPVKNSNRKHGQSKFKTLRYEGLFDLLSMLFIHKYGLNPLHFFGVASMFLIIPSATTLFVLIAEHLLYLFGFGDQYILFNRPLFVLALFSLLMGVVIFFTGFVCDFILHHQIRGRIADIVSTHTDYVIDGTRNPGSNRHR